MSTPQRNMISAIQYTLGCYEHCQSALGNVQNGDSRIPLGILLEQMSIGGMSFRMRLSGQVVSEGYTR